MATFSSLLGWLEEHLDIAITALFALLLFCNGIYTILRIHLYPTDKMMMLATILSTGQLTGDEPTSLLEDAQTALRHDISVEENKLHPDYDLIHHQAAVLVRVQTALNNRRGLDGMTLLAR